MDTFKAATWNVYAGSKPDALEPHLVREKERGVSLFFQQEAGSRGLTPMIEKHGLKTFNDEQWRISWDPEVWPHLISAEGRVLSQTKYWSENHTQDRFSQCVVVVLGDRKGRTLTALSYHLPAHVQVREDGQDRVAARVRATQESLISIGELAHEVETTGFLAGGDDNWDEDTGYQHPHGLVTKYLLGRATGMKQLQAGKPTFGKREIDDFRILEHGRVQPTGKPWVVEGGGEETPNHKIHGRKFLWVKG